jgi:hypothetical protein
VNQPGDPAPPANSAMPEVPAASATPGTPEARATPAATDHGQQFDRALSAFVRAEYEACSELLKTLLAMGSRIESLYLLVVCSQRLGKHEYAREIALRNRDRFSPWATIILRLTVGEITLDDALAQAPDDVHRVQARYYHAAGTRTRGEFDAFRDQLLAIVDTPIPTTLEKFVAASELLDLDQRAAANA